MDQFMILVQPGAGLPAIGCTLHTGSPLTGMAYQIKVTKIVGLKWNKENQLIVTVEGTRKAVENGPEADRTTK